MSFSLILATYGDNKVNLISNFLKSLDNQSDFHNNFELILVDQNKNEKILDLIKSSNFSFPIIYKKSEIPGLSRARNIGLKVAKYPIIAFPDDDCEYPPNLLKNVFDFFSINQYYNILAVDTRDIVTLEKLPYTKKISGRREIKPGMIFKAITSISIFVREIENIKFDEELGLGTRNSSCEEFDFVANLFKNGARAFFDEHLYVLHPNHQQLTTDQLQNKVRKHAIGHGAFFRKHFFYLWRTAIYFLLIAPIGGFLKNLITYRWDVANIHGLSFRYRLKGFITYKRNK